MATKKRFVSRRVALSQLEVTQNREKRRLGVSAAENFRHVGEISGEANLSFTKRIGIDGHGSDVGLVPFSGSSMILKERTFTLIESMRRGALRGAEVKKKRMDLRDSPTPPAVIRFNLSAKRHNNKSRKTPPLICPGEG